MDDALFNEAVVRALADNQISAALESLADGGDREAVRDDLVDVVRADVDKIESAASGELERLAAAEAELNSVIEPAIAEVAARNEHVFPTYSKLLTLLFATTGPRSSAKPASLPRSLRPRGRGSLSDLERLEADVFAAFEAGDDTGALRERVRELLEPLTAQLRDQVLAHPDEWPSIVRARARVEDARAAAVRAVLERGVLPACRAWVNEKLAHRLESRLSLRLEATEAPGLAELPNPDHEVPTPDGDHLQRVLGQLPGGSVGLSGPRGSGKTTLLRAFHQGRRRIGGRAPGLTAMVSAPVEYAPRDFVLHLFERVCEAATAELAPATADDDAPVDETRIRRALLLVASLSVAAVTIAAVLLVREARTGQLSTADQLTLAAGGLAGAAGLGAQMWRSRAANVATVVAAIVVCAAIGAVYFEPAQWTDWLWLPAIAGWLLLHASVLESLELNPTNASRILALAGLVEGGLLAVAGALGVDLGNRAPAGAVVLLVAAPVIGLATLPARWQPYGGALPPFLFRPPLIAAGLAADVVGLTLMAVDAPPSTALVVGLALGAWGLFNLTVVALRLRGLVDLSARPELDGADFVHSFEASARPIERLEDWLETASASPETRAEVDHPALLADRGEARAGVVQRLDALEEARRMLRAWRIGGGRLDGETLYRNLLSAWGVAGYGSLEEQIVEGALSELQRRRSRRQAWGRAAEPWLQRIQYQQSLSSTWSGKIGIAKPLAIEATRGGGRSVAELPMTLPQIVSGLQKFLQDAAEVEPVVIAIDELDKMASAESAERFLNEVKAIFGVSNCYFLISVSEDAVASFERRGLPFRDVIDSSFDEVLRVGYLSLEHAESLLAKRVVLLPLPFAALCHALSGGLARDLIRTTRALFDLRQTTGEQEMATLCRELAREELRAKRDGTVTAIRGLAETIDVSAPLAWLASVAADDLALDDLVADLARARPSTDQLESDGQRTAALGLQRLVGEFLAFRYLCVTLVDIFAGSLTFDVLRRIVEGADDAPHLDDLALVRQSFTIDSKLAWERISAVRRDWSLADLPAPPMATLHQALPVTGNGGGEP